MSGLFNPPLKGEVAARRADGGVSPLRTAHSLWTGDTPPSGFASHLPFQGRMTP